MKLKNIIIPSIAFISLFTGCLRTEEPVEEQKLNTISAVIEMEETRTSVTDEGYFTWSSGDEIWLQTTHGAVPGTICSGEGTPNAEFSYGSYVGELTGKAIYPYNDYHSISGSELSVYLPSVYDLGSSFGSTNTVMFAETVDNVLKFSHMAGVMRFTLKNVPAGTNQFKLTLDKKINGTFDANLNDSHPCIFTYETSYDSERTITLNFDPLSEASDICLNFPLPVGTYNYMELELNAGFETVWTYANSVSNTINRRSLLLMPAVTLSGSVSGEIDNDSIDTRRCLVYNSNAYTVTSGDSFWTMRPFLLSRVATVSDIELKFRMASSATAYLFYSERPYVNNGAFLDSQGLHLRFDNSGYNNIDNEVVLSWGQMGVNPTDYIVMRISAVDKTVTVNGNEIFVPEMRTFTDIGYLFSSYYYEEDGGYEKNYDAVPVGSKLFYAKMYDELGRLIYQGYPSQAEYKDGTIKHAWKSVYANNTYYEFAQTNFEQFWVNMHAGNLSHFEGGYQNDYSLVLTGSDYGWRLSTSISNPDPYLYDGVYESTNKGYNNSAAFMYIDIKGYDKFMIYVRSYAETNYDYVVVSNLDCNLTASTTSGVNVKMNTYSNQSSSTSISGYTLVEFNNIDGGEHRITIMFRKDSSQHNYDDRGYVLIPKNQ